MGKGKGKGRGQNKGGKKGSMTASNKGSADAASKGSVDAASELDHHPPSSKVCLYASCFVEHRNPDTDLDYDMDDIDHFYIFDLNQKPDGDFIPATPALRLRSKDFLTVCVLKSSLYLFDSMDMHSNIPKQNVYTYNLSSAAAKMARPDLVLELDDMEKARCMNGCKRMACAIATPDQQKILVFSQVIVLRPDTPGRVDFELYDSLTKKRDPLPLLPDLKPKGYYEERTILSHAFLDNSTFFIHIEDKERPMFTLNLEEQNAGWVEYVSSPSFLLNLRDMFFVVGGRLCFKNGVYDTVEDRYVYLIPSSPNARQRRRDDRRAITFLDRGKCGGDDDGHTLCVLESNFDVPYRDPRDGELILYYPRVYIDLYKLKVASCCGVDQLPESATTSLKFQLGSVLKLGIVLDTTFYVVRETVVLC
ncbi:hypothetical protein OROHE_000353 [Orobanche hederae]